MSCKKLISIALALLLSVSISFAQERLVGTQDNQAVKEAAEKKANVLVVRSAPVCELPFIDDFANYSTVFPNQNKWQGYSVYVNNSYGIAPPSIGVATLDAINGKGELYDVGNAYSMPADTLLSQAINLAWPGDSIYLTFYFQAGGYGDMPENRDSLILQFSPDGSNWFTVWRAYPNLIENEMVEHYYRASGKTIHTTKTDAIGEHFFKAHVKVDKPEFLTNNFRFRFINHVSITINKFVPGRASNADHWNLDFIYLDKGRNAQDTTIKDIAITKTQESLSSFYEEIPWLHYNSYAREKMFGEGMKINLTYSNLGWGTRNVARRFEINPMFGNGEVFGMSGGAENIDDFETFSRSYDLPGYDFYSDTDSAKFEIKSYIITDSDPSRSDFRSNDTTVHYQRFYDCYAYDDGSAENGYGLFGVGTSGGKIAIKFDCFAGDSLRGVYMYFNRTINDVNSENKFRLTVWNDDNGVPGEVLYTQGATKPTYSEELNQFVAYKFNKPIYIGRKTSFFVGWQQLNEDFINLGYDRNRNHGDKVFYNINNQWLPSVYEGSPMIRPIFYTAENFPDDAILPPTTTNSSVNSVVLSPNPASNFVQMTWADDEKIQQEKTLQIYDLGGRLVKTEKCTNNIINVSGLYAGTYIVRIFIGNKVVETKKIIVVK